MKEWLLCISLLTATNCFAYTFNLKVTYPDNEKKEFAVADKRQDVKLDSRKWKCIISENQEVAAPLLAKMIICSGPSDTEVSSALVCEPLTPQVTSLVLKEKNKAKTFAHIVKLECIP